MQRYPIKYCPVGSVVLLYNVFPCYFFCFNFVLPEYLIATSDRVFFVITDIPTRKTKSLCCSVFLCHCSIFMHYCSVLTITEQKRSNVFLYHCSVFLYHSSVFCTTIPFFSQQNTNKTVCFCTTVPCFHTTVLFLHYCSVFSQEKTEQCVFELRFRFFHKGQWNKTEQCVFLTLSKNGTVCFVSQFRALYHCSVFALLFRFCTSFRFFHKKQRNNLFCTTVRFFIWNNETVWTCVSLLFILF